MAGSGSSQDQGWLYGRRAAYLAAAEWILMIRNCFVREEEGHLILFSGIPHRWLRAKKKSVWSSAYFIRYDPAFFEVGSEKIKFVLGMANVGSQPKIEIHFCGSVIPVPPPVAGSRPTAGKAGSRSWKLWIPDHSTGSGRWEKLTIQAFGDDGR